MRSQRLSFPRRRRGACKCNAGGRGRNEVSPIKACTALHRLLADDLARPLTVNDRGVINAPRSSSKTNLAVASGTLRARPAER